MAHHAQGKALPALPSRRDGYSQETYAELLEQENQQLRLLNKEIQALNAKDDRALESERQALSQERARHQEEIRRRDKLIESIANTVLDVLDELGRYKDAIKEPEAENIKVYSKFEFESPI